jgi:hypothetical protein
MGATPIVFRCSACRHRHARRFRSADLSQANTGMANQVTLTGRTRKRRRTGGHRSSAVAREYRCQDCGHVGWAAHRDLDRLAAREEPRDQGGDHE